jgi:hypothetical protein
VFPPGRGAGTRVSTGRVGRRCNVRGTACLLALALSLAGCSYSAPPLGTGSDRGVVLRLSNTGTQPLRCRLLFGHWVERDLGEIAPDGAVEIDMMQATTDGALYIPRADGQRLMMIENVVCGRDGDWMASFSQVDLAPLRSRRPARAAAHCAASGASERVVCSAPAIPP